MLIRSHVYIASCFVIGIFGGCSDNHEPSSTHPHSDDHVLAQNGEAISERIIASKEEETRTKKSSRSADAHTHGDAELAVVLEKGSVTIELDTPLYNILGFEHAPETQAQKAAELQLTRSSDLFEFNSKANCKNLSQDQNISLFDKAEADEHSDHDDEGHDEENHHEDHDDEEGHDAHHQDESHNDEAHKDEAHKDEAHNDVLLTYEFKCEHPLKLSHLNVNLFEFFEELSEVDVTFLGPATQKQVTLTRTQRQLDITP